MAALVLAGVAVSALCAAFLIESHDHTS